MNSGVVVGGAFDACIGVPDLIEAIAYWELFGYRVGDIGHLDAQQARQLYGVHSAARIVRLWHQDADHGLLRLMQWAQPTGPGLGLAPFKCVGNRWTAAEVRQLARIVAHTKYRRESGGPTVGGARYRDHDVVPCLLDRVGRHGRQPDLDPGGHARQDVPSQFVSGVEKMSIGFEVVAELLHA